MKLKTDVEKNYCKMFLNMVSELFDVVDGYPMFRYEEIPFSIRRRYLLIYELIGIYNEEVIENCPE